MPLRKYSRVLFRKAPIRLVIGQVRFPLQLRLTEAGFTAPFQEALQEEYPVAAREQQVAFQVSTKGMQTAPAETLLRFSSRTGDWAVVLGESALTLEVRGYSAIEEFSSRVERVLTAAKERLRLRERSRLGLRYINEFRHETGRSLADWRKLLNPELLGFAGGELLEGTVEHMAHEIRVRRPDGVLAIRHGLLVGGVVEPVPSAPPADGRFYLLDMDYYDERPSPLDVALTSRALTNYNEFMYRFFRWSLGDRMYQHLEPTDTQATGYGPISAPVMHAFVSEGDPQDFDETESREPVSVLAAERALTGPLRAIEKSQQSPEAAATARLLAVSGVEKEKIATLLGVSRTTLYAWLRGSRPRGSKRDHLLQVTAVVDEAAQRLGSPRSVAAWLVTPSAASGRAPFDVLKERRYDLSRAMLTRRRTARPTLPQRAPRRIVGSELRGALDRLSPRPSIDDYETEEHQDD